MQALSKRSIYQKSLIALPAKRNPTACAMGLFILLHFIKDYSPFGSVVASAASLSIFNLRLANALRSPKVDFSTLP